MPNKEFIFPHYLKPHKKNPIFLKISPLSKIKMANKLKKLPNFLNKSPWLWRSCTQSRTLSFRTSNDIFKTINSAFEQDEEFEETPPADMSEDDQIEALVRGLSLRPRKRLFLELDETKSISTMPAAAAENSEFPFEESVAVAMAIESKEPYLDFKNSMKEMVEAHGLKDWKKMEMLLSWYLKANAKSNHEFIIGAFVDLWVGLVFCGEASSNHFSSCCCCLCKNSPSSSSSSLVCSNYSFPSSSCSSCGVPNCMISSSSAEVMEDIVEPECSTSSSTHVVAPPPPGLSSLFEDEEEEGEY